MSALLRSLLGGVAVLVRADVLRDLHIYGGLALAGVGGWSISPQWTCVFIGAVLFGMGVFAPLSTRKTP